MKMNVCWRRKDTQIETDPCVIQDVIELPESEYARFYQNLLDDYDFIAEHQDAMFYKDGQEHALLVLGEGQKDGILVSSEGTNYARYSSFIPHAVRSCRTISGGLRITVSVKAQQIPRTAVGLSLMKSCLVILMRRRSAVKTDSENFLKRNCGREKKSKS